MAIYKRTLRNLRTNTAETTLFDGTTFTSADTILITTGGVR